MDMHHLLIGLMRGLGLIALVALAYSWVLRAFDGRRIKLPMVGLLLAVGGILSMNDPVSPMPGVQVDARIPFVAVASIFAGGWGALIVAASLSMFRYWIGGAGAMAGIGAILITAATGAMVAMVVQRSKLSRLQRAGLLVLAANLSAVMIYTLPAHIFEAINPYRLSVILAFNTMATLMFDEFLRRQRKNFAFTRYLETEAMTDPLTGLRNRRSFGEAAARLFDVSERLSVIMLDIDHFKSINDQHGHQVGDEVLREIADIVTRSIRKGDIVARYGGEEIIVLVPGTDVGDAARIAEKIRHRIAGHAFAALPGLRVTVSVGTASRDHETDDLALLTRQADDALYRAKRNGRNRVEQAMATGQAPRLQVSART